MADAQHMANATHTQDATLGQAIPILRIFDVAKAREFYLDWLQFDVVFEHRFGDDFPLYTEIARDGCVLHLSEHHGDSVPGVRVYVRMTGLAAWHTELLERPYRYQHPELQAQDWGALEMHLTDPFGNRLTFAERVR